MSARRGMAVHLASLCLAMLVASPTAGAAPLKDGGSVVPTQTIRVGELEVGYRVQGQGRPLLLIMGFSGTMDLWDPTFLAALAEHHQVITFDNRGMGYTTAPSGPFSLPQLADDAIGLLDALGIERADVLGWSMGTYVAQELVLRAPERVDHLILYAGDCGGDQALQPSDEVLQQLTDTSGTDEERGLRLLRLLFPGSWLQQHGEYVYAVFSRPMAPVEPASVARQAAAIDQWTGTCERLGQVAAPTLVVTGTDDVVVPAGNSLQLVSRIPGAWLAQFPGGGHGLMFQEPERLAQVVETFLQDGVSASR